MVFWTLTLAWPRDWEREGVQFIWIPFPLGYWKLVITSATACKIVDRNSTFDAREYRRQIPAE